MTKTKTMISKDKWL